MNNTEITALIICILTVVFAVSALALVNLGDPRKSLFKK